MENKTTIYLNAIYQNAKIALASIDGILPKIEHKDLRNEILKEEKAYLSVAKKCEDFAQSNNIEDIKDNNWFEKARLWTSINIGTLTDKSNRKIAELMLLGTFMGIITCYKDESDHKNTSDELDTIVNDLKTIERNNIKRLLPFLNN